MDWIRQHRLASRDMMSAAGEWIGQDVLPTGTVTLLLGDLEGSVGLWERDEAAMTQAMSRVDELVAAQLLAHDGVCPQEQGEGDSFVLAFTRASDAVACALDLQRGFADEPWPGGLDLRFRMAVHTGEVELRDGHRYVGPAINRCARLRNLGRGGQTLLSNVTQGLVADRLPDRAGLRDLGEHELRGFARPETVFQLTHPALADDFPPLQVAGPVRSNLPTQVTSFVGRADEVSEVDRLLADTRLVTLLGAGGIGKTRLALEAAAAVQDRYDDGAWWVDLAPLSDPELVAPTVTAVVGVQQRPGETMVDALVRGLSDRRLLLVLDNCEHLVEAASSLVDTLVRGCPAVAVVATSREPLGVEGEVSLRVPSLAIPRDHQSTVEDIADLSAVCLFVDRAREVQPGFRLSDRNTSSVAEICRRLDGIPLAIELAAARVRLLTPAQVATGLSDRFRLLTGGPRTAMPRQRTLEASVAWSHDLLSTQEQLVLARLSVFAGTFDLDAAEAVCTDDTIDADAVLDLLSGLVDRSLVQVTQAAGRAHYRLLETIRVFARQQLATLDDPTRVRDRHLGFYRELAQQAQAGLFTDLDDWMERLGTALDDLRAAMDWAMSSGTPLAAVEIAEQTYTFWMVRGLYTEMHRRLDAAVTAPLLAPADRARGNRTASIIALMGGDYVAGYEFASRAVDLADEQDDPALEAHSHLNRAWTGFFCGLADDEQILLDLDRARDIVAVLDNEALRIQVLLYDGWLELWQRSVPDGTARLEECLEAARTAGLVHLQVPALVFLSAAMCQSGRLDEARRHGEQAVQLGRSLRFDSFVSLALGYLAYAHIYAGDEPAAREAADASRLVATRAGLQAFDLYGLRLQTMVISRFGDPPAARAAAQDLMQAIGPSMVGTEEALGHWLAGIAALRTGDLDEAREHLEAGRARSSSPSSLFPLVYCLLGLAQVAEAEDDIATAWELAHDALDVLATWGEPMGTADALESVAGLAVTTGAADKAARLLGAADRQRRDTGTTRMPLEAERYPEVVAAARSALGDEDFDQWFDEGAALALDEAVAYARRGRGERGRPSVGWQSLTPAELDVVDLVSRGLRNADIAEQLFVTVNTVKTHLSHVYTKLDLSTRAELAAEATRRAPTRNPGHG